MKKNKFMYGMTAAFVISTLSPSLATIQTVQAEDVWDYRSSEPAEYFATYNTATTNTKNFYSAYKFTGVIPINFSIPGHTNHPSVKPVGSSYGYSSTIQYFGVDMRKKSIQQVSFFNTSSISVIGRYYTSDTSFRDVPSFKDNEIRKIYWRASYANGITITDSVFENNLLTTLELPNEIWYIGNYTFAGNQLAKIYNQSYLHSVGKYAFANNKLISSSADGYEFQVPTNTYYSEILEGTYANNLLTEVTIPNSIVKIHSKAFAENPLKSVLFENPNIIIQDGAFGVPPEGLVILGRGNTSTAQKYAASHNLTYINIDQTKALVEMAESARTKDTYDTALEDVNALPEGKNKRDFENRLLQIWNHINAGDLVMLAETKLDMTSYTEALNAVNLVNAGTYKNTLKNRLAVVLKAIQKNRIIKIDEELKRFSDEKTLNLGQLDSYRTELATYPSSTEKTNILSLIDGVTDAATLYTLKGAKDRLELLKDSPTSRNSAEANEWINMLPDGFAYTDAATNETVSKVSLRSEYQALNKPIIATAAVEIAEKYLTEEKYQDAVTLVLDMEHSATKEDLRKRLVKLNESMNTFPELQTTVENLIEKANKQLTTESIRAAKEAIEVIPSNYWITYYKGIVEPLEYKVAIKDLKAKMDVEGPTEEDVEKFIVLVSLLPQKDLDAVRYAAEIVEYRKLLEDSKNTIKLIDKKINSLNVFDISSLNVDSYNELKQLIRDLPPSSKKTDLEEELNQLMIHLTNLQPVEKNINLIKNSINSLGEKAGSITAADLETLWVVIDKIEDTGSQKILKQYYNTYLTELIDRSLDEFEGEPSGKNAQNILNYITNVRDAKVREDYGNHYDERLKTVVYNQLSGVNSLSLQELEELKKIIDASPNLSFRLGLSAEFDKKLSEALSSKLVLNGNETTIDDFTDKKVELEEFVNLIYDTSNRAATYEKFDEVTNEYVSNYITNNVVGSLSENDVEELSELVSSLYSPTTFINQPSNSHLQQLLTDYFNENYSNVANNLSDGSNSVVSIEEMEKAYTFLSKFPGANFMNTYKEDIENTFNTSVKLDIAKLATESFNDHKLLENVSKTINNIDNAVMKTELLNSLEQTLVASLNTSLSSSLKETLSSGELTALSTVITTINDLSPEEFYVPTLKETLNAFYLSNKKVIDGAMGIPSNSDETMVLQSFFANYSSGANNGTNDTNIGTSNNVDLISEIESLKDSIENISNLKNILEMLAAIESNNSIKENTGNFVGMQGGSPISSEALQALLKQIENSKSNATANLVDSVSLNNLLERLAELKSNNAALNLTIEQNNEAITSMGAHIASISLAIQEKDSKIDALTETINQLKQHLSNLEIQVGKVNESTSTPIIESLMEENVSLQAKLVSQEKTNKNTKIGAGVSSALLVLLGLYSSISIRNNRKLIGSLEEKLATSNDDRKKSDEKLEEITKMLIDLPNDKKSE